MFGFLRRKRPTVIQVGSLQEAQRMLTSSAAKGEHVILDMSSIDLEELEELMLPMNQKTKLGRNDPCPCGSSRKYKKCCLPH